MFKPKITINKALFEKIKVAAQILGCASVEEFAEKVLEAESDKVISSTGKSDVTKEDVDDIAKKLQGLGYLD